jgi:HEAT repeat protein
MSELDTLYDRIARGLALPVLPAATAAGLLDKAREVVEDDRGDWDSALRVAATLRGWRAANLLRDAVRAGPFERSALALEWAPYAQLDGVAALCQGLELTDEALVLQALSLLSAHQSAAGTGRARRLLDHDSQAVRAAATTYLGLVAGPAVFSDLRPLLADEDLRGLAQLALDRLDGNAERPEASPWPSLDLEHEVLAEPAFEVAPGQLPEDPQALLSLLSQVAPQDRPPIVAALQASSPAMVAALIRPLVATSPSDLAVGGCRFAELTADPRWRLSVRRLLTHGSPRVRLCAAQALAAMGGGADLPALERASADPCAQVCEAAAAALAAVAEREG